MADILVVVEHHEGAFRKNTLSAVSAANTLAGLMGGEVDALVLGDGASGVADTVAGAGVRKVLLGEAAGFGKYLAVTFAQAVAQVVREKGYGAVFAPASTFGKDFMPRVSGLLDAPLASDIVGLGKEGDALRVMRPMYAGNATGTVELVGSPLLFTVRQTAFDAAPLGGAKAPVEKVTVAAEAVGTAFVGRQETKSERPELTEARVIVSAGRGIKAQENFKLVEELADELKAAIGASRAAVDAGWAPNDWQVGQTGKIVAPELYIALGISGAIQHLAGMKDSKVIVAINKDEEAPIFQVADYGLVGDLFKAVPELVAELKKMKSA
ncbi:MAG: electron transfer flavoprotein subunit alpha/FixB family protein [Deltaproteobacteria bacterium]|nr:MAG: electron transfer flavoprotein subunit alpha/FixB family protein [Deltaproteobacteria bacterium]